MTGAIRIAAKDLSELVWGARGIGFILPPLVLLLLVGQLQTTSPNVKALVSGVAPCTEQRPANKLSCRLELLVAEAGNLVLTFEEKREGNPYQRLRQGDFDIVGKVDPETNLSWDFYIAESRDPKRLARLLTATISLQAALAVLQGQHDTRAPVVMSPPSAPGFSEEACDVADAPEAVVEGLPKIQANKDEPSGLAAGSDSTGVALLPYVVNTLQSVTLRPAFVYFPRLTETRIAVLPQTVALILCFFPFVLAASSLTRERENNMFPILLTAPGIGWSTLLAGKCAVPLLVTLLETMLMLFLLDAWFAISMKSQLLEFALFLVPAILSSTFLGLAVSTTARLQVQVIAAAGLYFLGLVLLSGFLFPLDESSWIIRFIANLSPLTFIIHPLTGWMFGAGISAELLPSALALGFQATAYGLLAVVLLRHLVRSL